MNNMQALLQLASASFDSKIWVPEVRFLAEIWLGVTDTRFEVTDGTGGWHRFISHITLGKADLLRLVDCHGWEAVRQIRAINALKRAHDHPGTLYVQDPSSRFLHLLQKTPAFMSGSTQHEIHYRTYLLFAPLAAEEMEAACRTGATATAIATLPADLRQRRQDRFWGRALRAVNAPLVRLRHVKRHTQGLSASGVQPFNQAEEQTHAGYIECLHQAGDDTMCVITGEANAARLSREESKRLLVWHQAVPMLRKAAWRVLVTNDDD